MGDKPWQTVATVIVTTFLLITLLVTVATHFAEHIWTET